MKDMVIKSTIPKKRNIPVTFSNDDELIISYFFNQFVYSFKVSFIERNEENYFFKIDQASIDKNMRKEKRSNVEYKAIFENKKETQFGTVLDISENGLKLRTNKPIKQKKIELNITGKDLKSFKIYGEIRWEKKNKKNNFDYGIFILKKE